MKRFALAMAVGLVVFTVGCGGDEYEKQFQASMEHLQKTGLPLSRTPEPPAGAPATGGAEQAAGQPTGGQQPGGEQPAGRQPANGQPANGQPADQVKQ
ncbi:MAG TPA: hypothetical protein VFE46_09450 [Pirellulales bacterium]|jgi:hypothetical protein|nr:hypothetical protein [Pirellulales bacterium]